MFIRIDAYAIEAMQFFDVLALLCLPFEPYLKVAKIWPRVEYQ